MRRGTSDRQDVSRDLTKQVFLNVFKNKKQVFKKIKNVYNKNKNVYKKNKNALKLFKKCFVKSGVVHGEE